MELGSIVLIEVFQARKDKYHMFFLMGGYPVLIFISSIYFGACVGRGPEIWAEWEGLQWAEGDNGTGWEGLQWAERTMGLGGRGFNGAERTMGPTCCEIEEVETVLQGYKERWRSSKGNSGSRLGEDSEKDQPKYVPNNRPVNPAKPLKL